MIENFYTTTFTVLRMVWANDKSTLSYIGSFVGHLQQASSEVAQYMGLAFTKTFTVWTDEASNVQEGDTLSDGIDTYSVKAVNKRVYAGNNKHLELVVEKDEDCVSA